MNPADPPAPAPRDNPVDETEVAATLPLQPKPLDSKVRALAYPGNPGCPGHIATMVVRTWAIGDTLRCNLCAVCTANHERGTCSVLVDQAVSRSSAPLFSTRELSRFSVIVDGNGHALPNGAIVSAGR